MATGYERYKNHAVWEQLVLKRDALQAARFDDSALERARKDVAEWLDEALKAKAPRQPALYLGSLDLLSTALNNLPADQQNFAQFWRYRTQQGQPAYLLEEALKGLPLPSPKDLSASYVKQLDDEVELRTTRLEALKARIDETETSLKGRLAELQKVTSDVETLRSQIQAEREAIASVSKAADADMRSEWQASFRTWETERDHRDALDRATALEHLGTLAATAKAGEVLAEHAAGDLSASDWYQRASRERRAAQWMRAAAIAAFLLAGAVGYYIVNMAIADNFDLTVGDGILRATVAIVIGAFGALLLRESGRHFRESDTSEDVALSLKALAPFYAGSEDDVRHAARAELGDAVLVKNVLSRFTHRDAAKHASELRADALGGLVKDTTAALKLAETSNKP